MTTERLEALAEEWKEHPPIGDLMAGFVGYKYEKPKGIEEFLEAIGAIAPDGVLSVAQIPQTPTQEQNG